VQRVTLANRNTPPPQEIEYEATVVEASFNLSGMSKMPENPVKGLRGYYVIELEKRDEPMTEAYTTLKSHFINRLLMKKQSELYRTWVENLRKHSKIEISERMLNQTGI
jgi:parvulin-like peptidyl-prolyl isomerase